MLIRIVLTLTVCFLILLLSPLKASASPKLWIERDGGFFGSEYITDGKEKYTLHFFSTFKINDLESKHPELSSKFSERQSQLTKAHIFYWAGLGTIISSVFVRDTGTALTMIVGGFVSSLVGAHFGLKARALDLEIMNSINGVTPTTPQALRSELKFDSPLTASKTRSQQGVPLLSIGWEF